MKSSEPLSKGSKLLAAGGAGLLGGVAAAIPATNAMGQDKPLGLLMVGLSFIIGPLAMFIPAFLIGAGVALGSAVGLVAALLFDSWQARFGKNED